MWGSAVGCLVTLTLSLLAVPLAVRAQQPTKVPRVGYLSDESSSLGFASFEPVAQGLRDLGYLEGHTIVFEHRYAEGKTESLPALAALVRLKVDVIVAVGTPATRAAKNATDTIPIVFTRIADPVALGLVASLAQPSSNLTGVSISSPDLNARRLEILTEVVPGDRRVGVVWDPTFPPASLELREIERAAHVLHVALHPVEVRAAEELEAAMRTVVGQGVHALLVVPALRFTEQRHRLAALAVQHRLPTMLSRREHVEAGGLMSYGTNFAAMYRRAATYVDKILKGAKPADLPVEQAHEVRVGPQPQDREGTRDHDAPSLLLLADEVIQ